VLRTSYGASKKNFCLPRSKLKVLLWGPLANTAPKARSGWEAARPCVSKEAKPAKIVSLIEKIFCARPLKEKEIFAGFACPAVSGASRWAGLPPAGRQLVGIPLKMSSNFFQQTPPD